jgi:hypothetical protein
LQEEIADTEYFWYPHRQRGGDGKFFAFRRSEKHLTLNGEQLIVARIPLMDHRPRLDPDKCVMIF